ncbi:hypothetical protein N752_22015 [Desulforamulus aquiferis]|nr:hypothetical protein N752_22015 [Desulforamulus aquiferis]
MLYSGQENTNEAILINTKKKVVIKATSSTSLHS